MKDKLFNGLWNIAYLKGKKATSMDLCFSFWWDFISSYGDYIPPSSNNTYLKGSTSPQTWKKQVAGGYDVYM